jgi:hypothetical protein
MTITQIEIHFKTKVSHKHMVVIYHRNTPLPKVRKGLDRYTPPPGLPHRRSDSRSDVRVRCDHWTQTRQAWERWRGAGRSHSFLAPSKPQGSALFGTASLGAGAGAPFGALPKGAFVCTFSSCAPSSTLEERHGYVSKQPGGCHVSPMTKEPE